MGGGISVPRLTQLKNERTRHMDAVQAIDDEAAAIVAQKIAETQAVLEQWPHVVPKPPVTRFRADDPIPPIRTDGSPPAGYPSDLPPGVPVGSTLEHTSSNGNRRYRDPGGDAWSVTAAGLVRRMVKDQPQD